MNYDKAKELVTFKTGKLDSNASEEGGLYPFFTCAQTTYQINSFAFNTECVLLAGNNAGAKFPLKYYNGKFNAYQRTYIIETKQKNRLNIRYFYFFLMPYLKAFEQQATGATTKFLTMKILNNIQVALPEIEVQDKIAAILSAYDDLIETNNQRIATLEQLAQQIYKEWFVRMRFPGWENTLLHHGIPERWVVSELIEFGKVITGKTPSTLVTDYYGGDIPFIKTPDMHNNTFICQTEESLTTKGAESQISQKLPSGAICTSCIETSGVVSITTRQSMTNQQINSLVIKDETFKEYLFFAIKSLKTTIELFGSTGATMTNLSKGKFERLKIFRPNYALVQKFNTISSPMLEEIKTLSEQNIILIKTRNLLLPRLISGKLTLKQAEASIN